jgi:hypothetical protein
MSTNKNLFKEAIADAKAVREAALANAKAALEEALTPKLESMLAAKLQEMDNDFEEIDYIQRSNDVSENDMYEEEGLEEDFDLSEILAELEGENENLYEAKDEEEEDLENEEDSKSEGSISDMSVEELKDLIADIVHSELEQEEEETPEDEEAEQDDEEGIEMPDEDDEEVDLNELLAELDALDEGEEDESMQYEAKRKTKKNDEDTIDEGYDVLASLGIDPNTINHSFEAMKAAVNTVGRVGLENVDQNVRDLFAQAALTIGSGITVGGILASKLIKTFGNFDKFKSKFIKSKKSTATPSLSEMNEAIRTIKTLRNELNETNLLNAKLLYVNKIFKSKNLTESQKLKVIASFDKATTPKQAKQLFESIQSNFSTTKKSIVRESLGFASKPIGGAPRKQIIDTNDQFARWQKLANIK